MCPPLIGLLVLLLYRCLRDCGADCLFALGICRHHRHHTDAILVANTCDGHCHLTTHALAIIASTQYRLTSQGCGAHRFSAHSVRLFEIVFLITAFVAVTAITPMPLSVPTHASAIAMSNVYSTHIMHSTNCFCLNKPDLTGLRSKSSF